MNQIQTTTVPVSHLVFVVGEDDQNKDLRNSESSDILKALKERFDEKTIDLHTQTLVYILWTRKELPEEYDVFSFVDSGGNTVFTCPSCSGIGEQDGGCPSCPGFWYE